MIICFGMSWPASVYKTIRSRSVKGKSLLFLVLIFVGYLFGIAAKFMFDLNYVVVFYMINLLFVGTDIALYFKFKNNAIDDKTVGGAP